MMLELLSGFPSPTRHHPPFPNIPNLLIISFEESVHRKEACADVCHEASARVEDLDGSAIAAVLINVCMEYLKL